MPGINLLVKFNNYPKSIENEFFKAQNLMKHFPDYNALTLFKNDNTFLGFTGYDEYPKAIFKTKDYFIIVEGKVYNKTLSNIEGELIDIANLILNSDEKEEAIRRWIRESDGDYIILIIDKSRHIITIFNDLLGRLPIYFIKNDEGFILSREIKFITNFMKKVTFDKKAIVEYILFRYILGTKTLIEKVSRLEPSSIIQLNVKSREIKIVKVHHWNFEHKSLPKKSIKKEAQDLVEIFLGSCRDRINSFRNFNYVVALSGGLDSRSVAAGLKKLGVKFTGTTYLDFDKEAFSDVPIAKELADTLGIEWKLFNLKKPDIDDIKLLISLKDGLNFAKMSYILSFFKQIKNMFGTKIILFTGDNGNVLMPDLRPKKRLRNPDKLLDYILVENAIFNLSQIENLLEIDKNDIRTQIIQCIKGYPEMDLHQKYVHFIMNGNCFRLQFEGEDRNRFYFWSAAPLYSIFFFSKVMDIPDTHKQFYRLYRRFLEILYSEVAHINNANWNAPITSSRIYLNELAKYFLLNLPYNLIESVRRKYVKAKRIYNVDKGLRNFALNCLETSSIISDYLSISEVRKLIIEGCNEMQFYTILTMIEYMSNLEKQIKNRSEVSI